MIFLFFFFISSTLRRGDDPYAILGVTRDATSQQIRTAFRKIAFDHHPDRHKGDDDSYMIWLRANDAYDILSNPQRKLKYDQDGTVSESDSNDYESQQQQNTGGFYGYGHYGFKGSSSYSSSTPSYHTPLITEQLFPYLARDGNEWILFAFQHFDCPSCTDQQQIFEKFAYEIKDYVKVGRVDVTQAPNLADELGISSVPLFLSVKMINKSKYEVHKIGSKFSTPESAMNSLFKHWKTSIDHFTSLSKLNEWISNKHQSKVHVIEVRETTEKTETVHFKYAASKLRTNCVFSSMTVKSDDDAKKIFNISFKKLPIVLVYRSSDIKMKPIVIDSNGRRILDEIDELSMPLFPLLTSSSSLKRICGDWCIAHFGPVNSSFIDSSYSMPFNTARFGKNSKISSNFLNANERSTFEWIVIAVNKKKYWPVKFSKIHDFVSLCSNLYRADDVDDVMKNKESFRIQNLPFDFSDVKEFVVEKFNDENATKFVIVVVSVLVVVLFLILKPKSKQTKIADKKEENVKQKVDKSEDLDSDKRNDKKDDDDENNNENKKVDEEEEKKDEDIEK